MPVALSLAESRACFFYLFASMNKSLDSFRYLNIVFNFVGAIFQFVIALVDAILANILLDGLVMSDSAPLFGGAFAGGAAFLFTGTVLSGGVLPLVGGLVAFGLYVAGLGTEPVATMRKQGSDRVFACNLAKKAACRAQIDACAGVFRDALALASTPGPASTS